MALVVVKNLNITYNTSDHLMKAVDSLSFVLEEGQVLGVVGESGSGKTQMSLAILGLLPNHAEVSGSILFHGKNILQLPEKEIRYWRSTRMAMIFQDPMDALNPYLTIGQQLSEVLIFHKKMTKAQAYAESINMLEAVKITDAKRRMRNYPHEFSGGMRQRVMIAMALLCRPQLLIADEPTTALDVTVQAQLIELLRELKKEFNMTLLFISHDLGVVASLCDKVMVMRLGQKVEYGDKESIFLHPSQPYTRELLAAVPQLPANTYRAPISF